MANKRKTGSKRHVFKTRKNVGKPSLNTTKLTSTNSVSQVKSSRSKEKLQKNFAVYEGKTDDKKYEIIDVSSLVNILKDVAVCSQCHGNLSLNTKSLAGLATEFSILCQSCNQTSSFTNCEKITSPKPNTNSTEDYYDLNLRFVYGLRVIGKGYTSARSLCGVMNLPAPPSKFKKHESHLAKSLKSVCELSMQSAVKEAVIANDNNRDLCVAVDGSWQKRGHVSLNGVVSITSADTAKVVDFHAMSKYCQCPNRLQKEHNESCIGNYSGTSGGMEVCGAIELFSRSLPRYDVRYLQYLGDGDTNAYKSVCDAMPYGPNISIEKIECVGHVQKRMGSRLANLRKTCIDPTTGKKKLTGKKRLTEHAMKKIQIFYGLAIRRNENNLEGMRTAVWAIYFHLISSNANPTHNLCPKDPNTWCKYNKAQLMKERYDHEKHFHLPDDVMQELRPTFQALSDQSLLRKCLKGKTQNPNESLNNVIWARVPKRTFVTLETLNLGVYEAVLSYNEGYLSKVKVIEDLGFNAGQNMIEAMKRLDFERVRKANKAFDELEKKIRQTKTLAKRKLEDLYGEEEDPDNPAYSAGHY